MNILKTIENQRRLTFNFRLTSHYDKKEERALTMKLNVYKKENTKHFLKH